MSRADLVAMARRTLAHSRAGTVPHADGIARVPAADYVDSDRFRLEIDRIWKRVPLVLGFERELDRPGAYRAFDVAGMPVLLVRGGDGRARAFVNSCSHRGAIVVEEGNGTARRFTCPYHGWCYDQQGGLVGIPDRADFGELDESAHGLTRLPCEERAGLVFGLLDPAGRLDLDTWLAGYDGLLRHLGLDRCRLVGRHEVAGPNWKLAYDGYLDFYHLPVLHRRTFGPDLSNRAVYDAWGPHQRLVQPDARILSLGEVPEHDWPIEKLTSGVWTVFPNVSIAGFDVGGRMLMVSQLFPGKEVGTSTTVQNFLVPFEPNDEQKAEIDERIAFLFEVVRDEDYRTGLRIQRALATGAKTHVLFGRNEAGGQNFHRWVDSLVDAGDDAALDALLATAEVVHQP